MTRDSLNKRGSEIGMQLVTYSLVDTVHKEDIIEMVPNNTTSVNISKKEKELKIDDEDDTEFSCNAGNILQILFPNQDKMCGKTFWEKRVPIIKWLPKYRFNDFIHDFLAGVTVALTTIPQAIAYAAVAGMPPQCGLYASLLGPFFYVFLGTAKDITIGPTAILSLMTQSIVNSHGIDAALLITFLSGSIIFLLGIFQMGFLVDFISLPVATGFTSAAAVTIAATQVKDLLGYSGTSEDFIGAWRNLVARIVNIRLWDSVLGICTIIILLAFKELNRLSTRRNPSDTRVSTLIFSKSMWLLSTMRNALVVIVGAVIACYTADSSGLSPLRVAGHINGGLPTFEIPPFSTTINGTYYSFSDMLTQLGPSIAIIPMISILESISIAKAFAKGKILDATQEMIVLGVVNIGGSFIGSMPVTGSFTRTAVNNASGVKTPAGGLVTAIIIIMALSFLTGSFYYIPKASLAGLIICAMFFMIEYHMVPLLWKTKRIDLLPFLVTFFSCLFFSLDYGILVGIFCNLAIVLYDIARPKITVQKFTVSYNNVILLTPKQGLVFPAAEYLREVTMREIAKEPPSSSVTVIIDGCNMLSIDATVAKNLKALINDITGQQHRIIFWNWNRGMERCCRGIDNNVGQYFHYSESLHDLFQEEETTAFSPEESSVINIGL